MDIDYNLSNIMNAIKAKEQQNHTGSRTSSISATMNNRRRHTYIGAAQNGSETDVSSWKQNAIQSQVFLITTG